MIRVFLSMAFLCLIPLAFSAFSACSESGSGTGSPDAASPVISYTGDTSVAAAESTYNLYFKAKILALDDSSVTFDTPNCLLEEEWTFSPHSANRETYTIANGVLRWQGDDNNRKFEGGTSIIGLWTSSGTGGQDSIFHLTYRITADSIYSYYIVDSSFCPAGLMSAWFQSLLDTLAPQFAATDCSNGTLNISGNSLPVRINSFGLTKIHITAGTSGQCAYKFELNPMDAAHCNENIRTKGWAYEVSNADDFTACLQKLITK